MTEPQPHPPRKKFVLEVTEYFDFLLTETDIEEIADIAEKIYHNTGDKVLELLRELEWSGNHTDYEDSWGVITIACPSCRNARKDGHKENCKLSAELRQRCDNK